MKKLYSAIALAAIAFSASAQSLYFKGAGEGLSWDLGVDLEVPLANGNYTVTINDLTQFKVSTVGSADGWDEFNTYALYAAELSDKANLGKACATTINGYENNNLPWKGEYTIVIPADLSTITVTTTTPEPTGFTAVYVRGGMNEWLSPEDWQMTTTDGVIYYFDCDEAHMIPAGTEFKIADADWDAINYSAGDEVIPFDEPLPWNYNNSVNGVMSEDYTGTLKLNLVNGPRKDAEVTVYPTIIDWQGGVSEIIADQNAATEYFNLQGVRVANPENGLFIKRVGNTVTKVLVK